MNKLQTTSKKLIATVLGFSLAAIIYWTIPYNEIRLLSFQVFTTWFLGNFVVGILSGILLKNKPVFSSVLVLFGFILAVMLRIIYDVISDPSSHNLAGIELLLAGLYVFPAALLGTLIGNFINKHRRSENKNQL